MDKDCAQRLGLSANEHNLKKGELTCLDLACENNRGLACKYLEFIFFE